MTGKLFILSGASASGKTTLLNAICANKETRCALAPKYTERDHRGAGDDIIHVNKIDLDEYDLAYIINGKKYGLKLDAIKELIKNNYNPIIVISDFRIVKQLKELLNGNAISVYISSTIDSQGLIKVHGRRHEFNPTPEQKDILEIQFARLKSASRLGLWPSVFECMGELLEDWRTFIPDGKSMEIRAEKIKLFHNRYIDNIELFDHVILNYRIGDPSQMTNQMVNVLANYKSNKVMQPVITTAPLFVVAAASAAGKGILMEALNTIGKDKIQIIKKLGKRSKKPNDRRDGMEAIGEDGVFPNDFDIKWEFHKGDKWKGTEYAIRSSDLEMNIKNKAPQIVISNMEQFSMFRDRYVNNVVFIYLHGLYSDQDIEKYQLERCKTREEAEQRTNEITEVYQSYMDNISCFSHVLLNTTYPEDLFDQMFQLIQHYKHSTIS